MEIIKYVPPQSWNDKGLDWENPDPRNIDYVIALREALIERAAASNAYFYPRELKSVSPCKPITRNSVFELLDLLDAVSQEYLFYEYDGYKHIEDEEVEMWDLAKLSHYFEGRGIKNPAYGSLALEGGEWLKAIKEMIDILKYCDVDEVKGVRYTRAGAVHDPPTIAEANQKAIATAFEYEPIEYYRNSSVPSIYSWCGNTHYKTVDPNDNREDQSNNTDGYCGYVEARSFKVTGSRGYIDAKHNLLGVLNVRKVTGAVSYSSVLDVSTFADAGLGLTLGVNFMKEAKVDDLIECDYTFGSVDHYPINEVVPVSEFDANGRYIKRHSTKTGFNAYTYLFHNYKVPGGFKFQ